MKTIDTIMTKNPACCTTDTPIAEVARLMEQNDCGQIPVVNDTREPIGVITDRDIALRIVAKSCDLSQAKACDAMTSSAITVAQDDDVQKCLSVMEAEQIRRVPVVDMQGKLAGMVALADVVQCCREHQTMDVVRHVSEPQPQV